MEYDWELLKELNTGRLVGTNKVKISCVIGLLEFIGDQKYEKCNKILRDQIDRGNESIETIAFHRANSYIREYIHSVL